MWRPRPPSSPENKFRSGKSPKRKKKEKVLELAKKSPRKKGKIEIKRVVNCLMKSSRFERKVIEKGNGSCPSRQLALEEEKETKQHIKRKLRVTVDGGVLQLK